MTQLELWLLEKQLAPLVGSGPTWPTALVDGLAQMLKSVARRSEALSEHAEVRAAPWLSENTLNDLAQRCKSARGLLDKALDTTMRHHASGYRLAPQRPGWTSARKPSVIRAWPCLRVVNL